MTVQENAMPFILWENEDCPTCGDWAYVQVPVNDGTVTDGDPVFCDCGQKGHISCDSETDPYVSWDETPSEIH